MLIISGSDDPLAGGGQLTDLVGRRYMEVGVTDVTVKVYPGARHEVFNEINRDEVTADVIAWLHSHRPFLRQHRQNVPAQPSAPRCPWAIFLCGPGLWGEPCQDQP